MIEFLTILVNSTLVIVGVILGVAAFIALIVAWSVFTEKHAKTGIALALGTMILLATCVQYFGG